MWAINPRRQVGNHKFVTSGNTLLVTRGAYHDMHCVRGITSISSSSLAVSRTGAFTITPSRCMVVHVTHGWDKIIPHDFTTS